MKIAIVAQPWDVIETPFRAGSTISIVANNIAATLPAGCETVIVAGRRGNQPHRETTEHGVSVIRFRSVAKPAYQLVDRVTGFWDMDPPFFTSCWYYRAYQDKVARCLQAMSVDVVLLFTFFQFARPIRQRLPRATIVLRMAGDSLGSMNPTIATPYLGDIDLILGNSKFTTRRIQENLPCMANQCRTMYDGVDTKLFSYESSMRSSKKKEKSILFVGRVSPEKGVHVLFKAFQMVVEKHSDCALHIVGAPGLLPYAYHLCLSSDPTDRSLMKYYGTNVVAKIHRQLVNKNRSYIADLSALVDPQYAKNIHFHGPRPHTDLPQIYGETTVFAAPSVIREPFGIPVAEAMAMGLPIVATDGGGYCELIEHRKSGLLVERNNADQLGNALLSLLAQAEFADSLGVAARARIESNFTWRHSTASLLDHLPSMNPGVLE